MKEYYKCKNNIGNYGLYTSNKIYIIDSITRQIFNNKHR